jgi:hypothetical protein
MVRAANEVMQVTGIVEDSAVAKAEAKLNKQRKNEETFTGLRLMEFGRASLVGGVWGVLGLRRRILVGTPSRALSVPNIFQLYKSYTQASFLGIVRQETAAKSFTNIFYAGLPSVLAYHVSDWIGFISDALIDDFFEEEKYTSSQLLLKICSQALSVFAIESYGSS